MNMNGSGRHGSRVPRRPSWRIGWAVGALTVLVVISAPVLTDRPAWTEATWADSESGNAAFGTYQVPAPVYTSCEATGLLGLNSTLTIHWRQPPGVAGLALEYGQSDSSGLLIPLTDALLGNVTTTAVSGDPGAYTTVVRVGLLGGLVGGSKSMGLRYSLPNAGNDWKSSWMTVSGTWYLLGLGTPKCALQQ